MSRTKRLHVSWHIAGCAAGLLLGVAITLLLSPGLFASPTWLVISVALLVVTFHQRRAWAVTLVVVAGILIGLWRGSVLQLELTQYEPFMHQRVTLIGKLGEDPTLAADGEQRVRLQAITLADKSLAGEVWVGLSEPQPIRRGDIVMLEGTLSPGFGNLPASMHRAKVAEVRRSPPDPPLIVRDAFANGVHAGVPEPQASLGLGLLVGQQGILPEVLEQQLQAVGLTHIIVASGYNLTILVAAARRLFERISKYLATVSAGGLILGFMSITGFSPSMSRAGLVSGLTVAAWYYGRTMHPVVLLLFAAAVTVLVNPSYIWGDIGWYLSFLAFAGVLILGPLLHRYFWGDKPPKLVRAMLVETVAAQLLTIPLLLFAFGQLAVYALPANLLVLPLVPLVMILTFISGLASLIMPHLADVISLPATLTLQLMTSVVKWIANWPGATSEVTFSLWMLVISYGVIGLLIVALRLKTKHRFTKSF